MRYTHIPDATVIVGGSSSYCNACGEACFPSEPGHETLAGWNSNGEPGCGVVWTHVSTDYSGQAIAKATKDLRPDLEFVTIFP